MLFDVGSHMDRLDIFNIGETGSLAPVQELTDRLVICDPGILVADRDREKFEKSFGRFGSDISDDRGIRKFSEGRIDSA
jgi:hypothetical protein